MSAFIKEGKVVCCLYCDRPFKVSRKHFRLCSDECARKIKIDRAVAYYYAHKRVAKIVGPVDPVREATILLLQKRASKKQKLFPIHTKDLKKYLPKGE